MPSTNVEFVTELMEFSAHGALIQAFVMQALEQYARRVASMDSEALDTPMVSGRAWWVAAPSRCGTRWRDGWAATKQAHPQLLPRKGIDSRRPLTACSGRQGRYAPASDLRSAFFPTYHPQPTTPQAREA